MIANHGQKTKYDHQIIGINSRLDTMQAAILNVKLRHLHTYNSKRKKAAHIFNHFFEKHELLQIPENVAYSDHVYNQYTLKVPATKRDLLRDHLHAKGIPTMIYYPAPLHLQPVFKYLTYQKGDFPVAEKLCTQVLSLPMHTELHEDQLIYISQNVLEGLEKLNIKDVLL
jgi:UDP-2-acetamido-2-deoxy-ribo-hexuluronate aminotransferase